MDGNGRSHPRTARTESDLRLAKEISCLRLFSAEDFFQEWCRLGGGRCPNLYFFLSQQVEQAIQSFAHDVLVQIELVSDGVATGGGFDDLIILLDNAGALQGAVDDRRKGCGEIGRAGLLEIFGGSGVAPRQEAAGRAVGNVYPLERVQINMFVVMRG